MVECAHGGTDHLQQQNDGLIDIALPRTFLGTLRREAVRILQPF
jgi:hypothetical protein